MKYIIQLTIPTYVWANFEVESVNESDARLAAISAANDGSIDFEYANYSTDEAVVSSVELVHELIIKSYYDANAVCSCGGWSFMRTGRARRFEITREFELHLKQCRKEKARKK